MRKRAAMGARSKKGGLPVSSSTIVHPRLQISHADVGPDAEQGRRRRQDEEILLCVWLCFFGRSGSVVDQLNLEQTMGTRTVHLDDLWGHPVGGAHHVEVTLLGVAELERHAKVRQLHLHSRHTQRGKRLSPQALDLSCTRDGEHGEKCLK